MHSGSSMLHKTVTSCSPDCTQNRPFNNRMMVVATTSFGDWLQLFTLWLLLSWLLHKQEGRFSDTNFEIGNPCRLLTECFSLHHHLDEDWSIQWKRQQGFPISKLVSENSLSPSNSPYFIASAHTIKFVQAQVWYWYSCNVLFTQAPSVNLLKQLYSSPLVVSWGWPIYILFHHTIMTSCSNYPFRRGGWWEHPDVCLHCYVALYPAWA